jgi:hypothetical protein
VIGALTHLGLALAYALSGDTAKAKAAYQDFLAIWKDADPDIHPEAGQCRVREAATAPLDRSQSTKQVGNISPALP